jgi:hypothetical protein
MTLAARSYWVRRPVDQSMPRSPPGGIGHLFKGPQGSFTVLLARVRPNPHHVGSLASQGGRPPVVVLYANVSACPSAASRSGCDDQCQVPGTGHGGEVRRGRVQAETTTVERETEEDSRPSQQDRLPHPSKRLRMRPNAGHTEPSARRRPKNFRVLTARDRSMQQRPPRRLRDRHRRTSPLPAPDCLRRARNQRLISVPTEVHAAHDQPTQQRPLHAWHAHQRDSARHGQRGLSNV